MGSPLVEGTSGNALVVVVGLCTGGSSRSAYLSLSTERVGMLGGGCSTRLSLNTGSHPIGGVGVTDLDALVSLGVTRLLGGRNASGGAGGNGAFERLLVVVPFAVDVLER